MISIENLTMEFAAKPVLNNITFLINRKDRIALVGKNGAGKTTLLRLLAGEYQPTEGTIAREKDMTIGYLPQHMIHAEGTTVMEEVKKAFAGHKVEEWEIAKDTERTLIGLGFERTDFERPCSEFSGGWRMRIELAKILLRKPDLLLLDEPTNHLDIESIQWLEGWLTTCGSAVLLVSHDRAFIDNVTNRTIEIMLGSIYDYQVNYSKYVTLRAERREQQIRAYENQQKLIQDAEEFIERFRYKPTKSVQVQQRIKQLEKLERIEVDEEDNSRLRLKFPPAPRSGDYPIICDEVRKDYGAHTVFDHVTLTIRRGEKVAFVGKNGEGKSTLVKCIMQEIEDYTGNLKVGHGVQIGYFAQNQASLLDENKTIFETIDYVAVGDIRTKIRDILGAFMFGGEASDKYVKVLSGGERSRLAMIRLLLEPVNLLILDEPTNHLDMRSKDVLKEALQEFDGTLIVVSHDRDFLSGLVDKVYEFGGGKVREYLGGISDWLRSKGLHLQGTEGARTLDKAFSDSTTTATAAPAEASASKLDYAAQKAKAAAIRKAEKAVSEAEAAIEHAEKQIADMEELLTLVTQQTSENFAKYDHYKRELEQKMYEWELLSEELESLKG